MNNFAQRPTPAVAATRQSDTYADTMGAGLSCALVAPNRHIRIGGDFEAIDKGFMLYNPLGPPSSSTRLIGRKVIGSAHLPKPERRWE
jgi:hypothetical protein